jgi:hypothetical protein
MLHCHRCKQQPLANRPVTSSLADDKHPCSE